MHFGLFSDIDVSQGSLATHLRCGGIVNDDFVAYLLVNLSVKKKIENWSTFGKVMDSIIVDCFLCMCAFGMLYLVSSVLCQEIS